MRVKLVYRVTARILHCFLMGANGLEKESHSLRNVTPMRVKEYLLGALQSGHDVDYLALP